MRSALYTYNGTRWLMHELVELSGVPRPTLHARIMAGWTIEQAIGTPTPKQRRAGVVSNLPAFEGTGGGSLPQAKNPEYNFSGIEA